MIEKNQQGEVWVFAEQEDGRISDVPLELLSKGRELADVLGVRLGAMLLGDGVEDMTGRLIAHGTDKVYLVDEPKLAHYQATGYCRSICALVEKYKPQIILFGATPIGRDLAPTVASSMKCGLTADCTDLQIGDHEEKGGTVHENLMYQIRPAFGGNIIATIVNLSRWPQMATVREGVMPMTDPDESRTGEVIRFSPGLDNLELPLRVHQTHRREKKVNLKAARIIVTGGAGVGSKDNFKLIRELAGCLGVRRWTVGMWITTTRAGRRARPFGRRCTSRWASAGRCSTARGCRNRPRYSPSTRTATPTFSPSPTTGSSAT